MALSKMCYASIFGFSKDTYTIATSSQSTLYCCDYSIFWSNFYQFFLLALIRQSKLGVFHNVCLFFKWRLLLWACSKKTLVETSKFSFVKISFISKVHLSTTSRHDWIWHKRKDFPCNKKSCMKMSIYRSH